jgi:hypothetical protein
MLNVIMLSVVAPSLGVKTDLKEVHWLLGNKDGATNLPTLLAKWMGYLCSKGLWWAQEGRKPICHLPNNDLKLTRKYDTKELLLKGKAQYS